MPEKFKDTWVKEYGVTYIPVSSGDCNLRELSEWGFIDPDSVPESKKSKLYFLVCIVCNSILFWLKFTCLLYIVYGCSRKPPFPHIHLHNINLLSIHVDEYTALTETKSSTTTDNETTDDPANAQQQFQQQQMFMGTFPPPGGPPTQQQQGVIPSLGGIRPPMPMMMQPGFRGNLIIITSYLTIRVNDITKDKFIQSEFQKGVLDLQRPYLCH